MKFLVETGKESHSKTWQSCQAKFVGGACDGQYLYQDRQNTVSTEWLENSKHVTLAKTTYELPAGTRILIDYKGYEGPEKFILELDESQEVQEREVGNTRLRTYTIKGRYRVIRDLVKEKEASLKKSQEEGF